MGVPSIGAIPYGTYSTSTTYSTVAGDVATFPDEDLDTSVSTTVTRHSETNRRCILVKNGSGGTLSPGHALKWVATYFGTQVQKATNGAPIAGYVPYTINGSKSTTIPDGAYFWMVVEGPSYALTDGDAITELDQLEASATAGTVKTDATVPAANKAYRGGSAMLAASAKGTGPDVYVRVWVSTNN